jgi:hypothetical protein
MRLLDLQAATTICLECGPIREKGKNDENNFLVKPGGDSKI